MFPVVWIRLMRPHRATQARTLCDYPNRLESVTDKAPTREKVFAYNIGEWYNTFAQQPTVTPVLAQFSAFGVRRYSTLFWYHGAV